MSGRSQTLWLDSVERGHGLKQKGSFLQDNSVVGDNRPITKGEVRDVKGLIAHI